MGSTPEGTQAVDDFKCPGMPDYQTLAMELIELQIEDMRRRFKNESQDDRELFDFFFTYIYMDPETRSKNAREVRLFRETADSKFLDSIADGLKAMGWLTMGIWEPVKNDILSIIAIYKLTSQMTRNIIDYQCRHGIYPMDYDAYREVCRNSVTREQRLEAVRLSLEIIRMVHHYARSFFLRNILKIIIFDVRLLLKIAPAVGSRWGVDSSSFELLVRHYNLSVSVMAKYDNADIERLAGRVMEIEMRDIAELYGQ